MKYRAYTLTALAGAMLALTQAASAADKVQDKDQARDQTQTRSTDRIYGSQLMTEQERIEHRNKIRNMKTAAEREAYLKEHHARMQARAKEKGVTLPEEPPLRGPGMGPGGGMGAGGGMGPGGGMGAGGGMGPGGGMRPGR